MKEIFSSATKLVLLYIVLILGILSMAAGLYSIFTNTFGDASKIILGLFGTSISIVIGFYFGAKSQVSQN